MGTPDHMKPMSREEIQDLLSATLHGPLPEATVQRLLATVAMLVDAPEFTVAEVGRFAPPPQVSECSPSELGQGLEAVANLRGPPRSHHGAVAILGERVLLVKVVAHD